MIPARLTLVTDRYSDAAVITDENGFQVVDVPNNAILLDYSTKLGIRHWAHSDKAYTEKTREQQEAFARRVVACWNACGGVKTEILEQAGTRNDWCDLMQGLEQERDEALGLLRELMDTELAELACAGSHAPVEDILGRIQATINKAKGGAT